MGQFYSTYSQYSSALYNENNIHRGYVCISVSFKTLTLITHAHRLLGWVGGGRHCELKEQVITDKRQVWDTISAVENWCPSLSKFNFNLFFFFLSQTASPLPLPHLLLCLFDNLTGPWAWIIHEHWVLYKFTVITTTVNTYALEQQQQRKACFTWNGEAHVREAAEVVPCPMTAIVARAWGCGAGYHKWTLAGQHPQYAETSIDGQGLQRPCKQVCAHIIIL